MNTARFFVGDSVHYERWVGTVYEVLSNGSVLIDFTLCPDRSRSSEGRTSPRSSPVPDIRTITFPNAAVVDVANRLCDLDYNLPGDEAEDIARDIVINVTMAVDKLRAREAMEGGLS